MKRITDFFRLTPRSLLTKAATPGSIVLAPPSVQDFRPVMWAGRRMTPDQVRFVIEGAVGGNLQEQWALFDMMEDTWPRLQKNLSELRRAATRNTYTVQPYVARGEEPTPRAQGRADLVEAALRNWRPRPGTLELGFEDALGAALDAVGKGLAVVEITWQRTADGLMPRCGHLLPPAKYSWNAAGNELGLVAQSSIGNHQSEISDWQPFPPGQFWVGVWHGRAGVAGQTALLRALAPYWCGVTFGWEWLLSNAQIFGVPFRWATYDPNQPQLLGQISTMLGNLGAAGWAAFPQGTTLDFKEAVTNATGNPQILVQELANKYCDQLILGQEASSETKPAGIGSGASELHGRVRTDRMQEVAQWCADLLNYQLVPAILRWNWGDEDEPPTIAPEVAGETDPKAKAERDVLLTSLGLRLPAKFMYARHEVPPPEDGEETVGGTSLPPPVGSTGALPAPGESSDADKPGAGQSKETDSTGLQAGGGSLVSTGAPRGRSVNPPRSAVALAKEFSSLPGDYRAPAATQRRLAEAHAADLAPLRQASAPLLAAIEAGNLDVVGELEAFIARLDALAPKMAGAQALADTLEAALAEAAIAGAAGAYAKLPAQKTSA